MENIFLFIYSVSIEGSDQEILYVSKTQSSVCISIPNWNCDLLIQVSKSETSFKDEVEIRELPTLDVCKDVLVATLRSRNECVRSDV